MASASTFPPLDGSAPKTQKFSAAPELGIDPAKRYTATIDTSLGELVVALDAAKRPEDRQQLRVPRPPPLLRRRHLPPHHQRLHVPGRRPDRHRHAAAPATASTTSCPSPAATRSARWRWPTPGRTPTAASSSSCPGPSGVGLPPLYSLFGKVVKGLDVVDAMQRVATDSRDRPHDDVVINSVTISESDD